ncbi:dynamin family protein, partial [Paenibacillus sp. N3.4]|uniref:dynamin family protein n=1 Tax=Paenibacillus sp. N3.4 TaxID=2603222 RepID=UPI0011C91B37
AMYPVRSVSYEIRSGYLAVLYKCLLESNNKLSIIDEYFKMYFMSFQITKEDANLIKTSIQDIKIYRSKLKLSTKNHWYRTGFLQFTRGNYKYSLFVDEILLRLYMHEGSLEVEQIISSAKKLRISNKRAELLSKYCISIYTKDSKASEALLLSIQHSRLHNEISFLHKRLHNNLLMNSYRKFHVPVVATMSAGKSTFINSLVGDNIFPSKNQACTSKYTSITSNQFIHHPIGRCNMKNTKTEYAGVVTKEGLLNWNEDPEVESIELECHVTGIRSSKTSIVLYDTPGTNFSQDTSHSNITYRLMENGGFNLIIYLFNACNIATNDDKILLEKLRRIINDNPETAVLFVLNKVDEFDVEGNDNLHETMNQLSSDLEEIGFNSPSIIPTSAYAAKLFKLALKGVIFTKKEAWDFERLVSQFSKSTDDLTQSPLINDQADKLVIENHSLFLINGNQYSSEQLLSALRGTNIPLIEQYVDNLIMNY